MKRLVELFIIGFLLITLTSNAQLGEENQRIILNLTESPATSMAVTWRTLEYHDSCFVRFNIAGKGTGFVENADVRPAKAEMVITDKGDTVYHYSCIMDQLKPATKYAYCVGRKDNWSEWNQFTTAGVKDSSFSFIYFGDPQNEIYEHIPRVFREAFRTMPDANFWLFVGDLISSPQYDLGWEELFYAGNLMFRMTPSVMVPGNHEYVTKAIDSEKTKQLTELWKPHFTLPENGMPGMEEKSYYFDYMGVRFIMLDTSEKLEMQIPWLDSLLANNPNSWTILAMHHPVYSVGRNRDSQKLRDLLLPVIDKYSIDLVLQGHDHAYGRSAKLKNGEKVGKDEPGTTFVVSVSGPKVYELNENLGEIMEVYGTGMELYQTIKIEKNILYYKAYTADGMLYDSFTIEKP
jgi:Purple acid Phosphatase, N-terminal domain/Calcineurin-like phosphoesterase